MTVLRLALARSVAATALAASAGATVLILLGHVTLEFAFDTLLPRLVLALGCSTVTGWLVLRPAKLLTEGPTSSSWPSSATRAAVGTSTGWLVGAAIAALDLWTEIASEGLAALFVATLAMLPAVTAAAFTWTTVDAAAKRFLRAAGVRSAPWPRASIRRRLLTQSILVAILPPALVGMTLWHFVSVHAEPPPQRTSHAHHSSAAADALSGRGVSAHDHDALLALVGFVLVAAGIAAARLGAATAAAVSEPVEDLVAGLQRIREGDLSHRVSVLTTDELGRAAVLFNDMAERVAERAWLHEAFGRYVSRDVAEAILDGRITTNGEQLEVSLLFADIRGFTSLSENLAPVELLDFLNRYLSRMIAVVSARGGRLDKVMGDGLFFVFGAPVRDEAHAEHAVEAALDMREALHAFNNEAAALGRPALRIGIGVHSGQVVAGSVGSAEHKLEYTVLGDAVNVAARVEGLTKDLGQDILVTDATRERIRHERVTFTAMAPTQVKGRAQLVQTFAIARVARS